MANGIRTGDPRGFNEGRRSKFRVGSRVRQTPEKDRMTYRPKRCGNNNKDEANTPKTLNEKNSLVKFSFFQWSSWMSSSNFVSPVSWSRRIHRLHLCRRVRHSLPRQRVSWIWHLKILWWLFGLVSWVYGISTFVGYLMPNPFLCK